MSGVAFSELPRTRQEAEIEFKFANGKGIILCPLYGDGQVLMHRGIHGYQFPSKNLVRDRLKSVFE